MLMVENFLYASSKGTCCYAYARSNLEEIFPPSKDAKISSIHGRGHLSNLAAWFTVTL